MGTLSLPWIVLVSTLGISPIEDVPCDRVDLIEVNHFHDDQGRLVFDQVIYYRWSETKGRHQVQAWRLLKQAAQKPQLDYATGEYVAIWQDGEVLREVRAKAARETWTQHDPELVEREYLAKEKRVDLTKLRPARSKPTRTPEPTATVNEVVRN